MLPFQYIQNTVNCAKSACASASCTAVHHNWSLSRRVCLVIVGALGVGCIYNFVAFFNQAEEVNWLGCSTKVGPVRIMQLCNFTERLKWICRVRQAEISRYNIRTTRILAFFRRGRTAPGVDLLRVCRVQIDLFLGEVVDFQGSVAPRLPKGVTFDLPSLNFGSQRHNKSGILFPNHAPKILFGRLSLICFSLFFVYPTPSIARAGVFRELTLKVSGTGACVAI